MVSRLDSTLHGLKLDDRNRVPLYHQLFLILRSKIIEGEYPLGSFLPGELEIAAHYNVSRITANRALNELAANGLATREKGRGTRVLHVADGTVLRGPVESNLVPTSVTEGKAKVSLLAFDHVQANAEVAAALDIEAGCTVQRAERIWRLGVNPFAFLTTFIPLEVGNSWTSKDMGRRPLSALLAESGVTITRIEETVTASLADIDLARRLKVDVGSPLIKIYRLIYDQNGRRVEYLIAYYPPERYEYRTTLARQGGELLRR